MTCQVANSQGALATQLPALPGQLPTTQAQWTQFLTALRQWGGVLQQLSSAPNVLPAQLQTFSTAAATPTLAALTTSDATASIDDGEQYYGGASLKVVPSAIGATLAFSGYPIPIAPGNQWYCSFQVYAPDGLTGSLTVTTSGGTTLTEDFSVDASQEWQQVWGLFDLSACTDPTATWTLTLSEVETAWFDGLQMSLVGDALAGLPPFTATGMIVGGLAYADNLDDIPDGSSYSKVLAAYVAEGVPYNYQGAWDSATAYVQGDEVSSGGNYYLALQGSTDVEPPSSATWQLLGPTTLDDVADGESYSKVLESYVAEGVPYNFQGSWSSTVSYVQGAEVTSGGNYYLATAASTNEEPPNADYWQLLGPATLDDVVDGSTYSKVLAAYVSEGIPYNYLGPWSSSTAYAQGAEVSSGGNYYLATASSTNEEPPNATYWQLLGPQSLDDVANGATYSKVLAAYVSDGIPYNYQGDWGAETAYSIGEEVSWSGNYYLCIAASAAGTEPSNATYWELLGPTTLDDVADGSTYSKVLESYVAEGVPYNYQGAWASGTTYVQGDEVSSGGNYYLAIAGSLNEEPPSDDYWVLLGPDSLDDVVDGSTYSRVLAAYVAEGIAYNYQGPWSASTAYAKGAEVTSGGVYYLATASSTNEEPPNASYWQALGPVDLDNVADGITYSKVLAAYVAEGVPYNYQGAWDSATAYVQGDEVSSGGNYYLALQGSTDVEPPSSATWQLLGPTTLDDVADGESYSKVLESYVAEGVPYNFQGSWSATVSYVQGAEVTSGGNYYLATAASTNEEPPNADYWQLLGPATLDDVVDGSTYSRVLAAYVAEGIAYNYQGPWSASTAYAKGAEVTSGGVYYLATASSTNEEPPNASYWQALGPVDLDNVADGITYSKVLAAYVAEGVPYNYQGAWDSATAYVQGDEVSSGGNYYLALQGSTDVEPPSSATWQLLGPTTLDDVADGESYSKVLESYVAEGVPYNFQGSWSATVSYVQGAEVTSGGNYYLATAASTNEEPPNADYWQLLGPATLDDVVDGSTYSRVLAAYVAEGIAYNYQGPWSASTAYAKGAEVTSGGVYYLATASSTNEEPPNASYWQALGPVDLDNVADGITYSKVLAAYVAEGVPYNYQGAWDSATAYVQGDEVSSGGNYYLALQGSTDVEPPSSATWQLLGPTTLDDVADGESYSKVLESYVAEGVPYNFQGSWSATVSYVQGAEVTSGGNYYLATAASTNEEPPNADYWQLLGPATLDDVVDGSTYSRVLAAYVAEGIAYNYQGPWSASTAYAKGAEVTSGGVYYLATASSTNEEPPNASYWQALGPVDLDNVADGITYSKVLAAYVAEGVPYNYQGAWDSATAYVQGDEVSSGGNYYLALQGSTDVEPPSSATWQLLGPTTLDDVADGESYSKVLESYVAEGVPYNFQGSWSATVSYVQGAEVTSGGNYYLATAASTNEEPPNADYWQLLGPATLDDVVDGSTYSRVLAAYVAEGIAYNYQGPWSASTAYAKGAEVTSGGVYYLATASSTNEEPPNASYWQALGPVDLDNVADGITYSKVLAAYVAEGVPYNYQGAWDSATAYVQGDEVSSGGNYYLALQGSTDVEPPSSATWQLLGPTTLDDVADGESYSKVLESYVAEGVPYNFQGSWSATVSYVQGAEVTSGGNYYLATAASTNEEPPNADYWQLLGPATLDDVVDGSTYSRVLAAYVAEGIAYNYQGPWSASTAYAKGAEVTSGGVYYLATASSTNEEPPNASYWQALGPQSLDDVAQGETYGSVLQSGLTSNVVNTQGLVQNAATTPIGIESSASSAPVLYLEIDSSQIPSGESTVPVQISASIIFDAASPDTEVYFDLALLPGIIDMGETQTYDETYTSYIPTYTYPDPVPTGFTEITSTQKVTTSPWATAGNYISQIVGVGDGPFSYQGIHYLAPGTYTFSVYYHGATDGWSSMSRAAICATLCAR